MQSELIQFTHRGVKINIKLDYERKTVSFIDNEGKPNLWCFVDRTRQYMGGWHIIMEALQEATKFADKRLKEQEDVRAKKAEDKVFNILTTLSELSLNKPNQTQEKENFSSSKRFTRRRKR